MAVQRTDRPPSAVKTAEVCKQSMRGTRLIFGIVWDVWGAVEEVRDAMATVRLDYAETVLVGMCADDLPHLPESNTGLDGINCLREALGGGEEVRTRQRKTKATPLCGEGRGPRGGKVSVGGRRGGKRASIHLIRDLDELL